MAAELSRNLVYTGQYDKNPGARMNAYPLALLLALLPAAALAQTDAAPIQERMTPEEFKAAGLDKLDKTELKNLNDWINGVKTVVVEKVVEKVVEVPVTEKEREPTEDFQSTIVGEFSGFKGNTRITLANGQIWQQADGKQLHVRKSQDPKASFSHSEFAGWKVQIEGYNAWIRVKRVN